MKTYLSGSKLSLGGDNRLLIVVADGLNSDYFLKHEDNLEYLKKCICESVGKEVAVEVKPLQKEQNFSTSYVDLAQMIRMDIEEE